MFGKEWRKVQQHVGTRTSTQARSHAQKFFVKLEKKGKNLDDFLKELDLDNLEKDLLFSDLEDEDSVKKDCKDFEQLQRTKSASFNHSISNPLFVREPKIQAVPNENTLTFNHNQSYNEGSIGEL